MTPTEGIRVETIGYLMSSLAIAANGRGLTGDECKGIYQQARRKLDEIHAIEKGKENG